MAAGSSRAAGGGLTVLQQLKHSVQTVPSCFNVFPLFFCCCCLFLFFFGVGGGVGAVRNIEFVNVKLSKSEYRL